MKFYLHIPKTGSMDNLGWMDRKPKFPNILLYSSNIHCCHTSITAHIDTKQIPFIVIVIEFCDIVTTTKYKIFYLFLQFAAYTVH